MSARNDVLLSYGALPIDKFIGHRDLGPQGSRGSGYVSLLHAETQASYNVSLGGGHSIHKYFLHGKEGYVFGSVCLFVSVCLWTTLLKTL